MAVSAVMDWSNAWAFVKALVKVMDDLPDLHGISICDLSWIVCNVRYW